MFFQMATTITLIISCLDYALAHNKNDFSGATSTQSFKPNDTPISYKYTTIHVYDTQKPIDEDGIIRPQPNQNIEYHVVQYAPLIQNLKKKDSNNTAKKTNINLSNSNLEPRKYPTRIGDTTKLKYSVPGHNIDVKRSSNRNIGHNAMYHSDPEDFIDMHNEASNILRNYKNPQDLYAKNKASKLIRPQNYLKQEPLAWYFEQNEKPDPYIMFRKGERSIPPNPNTFPKHHSHRMKINVARFNGHGQIISREIVIGDFLNNLGKPQSYENTKGAQHLNEEPRTLLYPKRLQQYKQHSW